MKFSFAKRLILNYILVVVATLILVTAFLLPRLQKLFLGQLEESLASQASVIAAVVQPEFPHARSSDLQGRADTFGTPHELRVTIIRADGKVLADSERTPNEVARMDNHLQRPEIQQALETGHGESKRVSDTLHEKMLYLALPLREQKGGVVGFLRVALPLVQLDERLAKIRRDLIKAGIAALFVSVLIALVTVRRLSRPLRELTQMAEAIGRGATAPMRLQGRDEFAGLASTISEMAAKIDGKVGELKRGQSQLTAILSALIEGIIALDYEGRILFLNPAAERLFGVDSKLLHGRPFLEGLRNTTLNRILKDTLSQSRALSGELILHLPEERMVTIQTLPVDYGEPRPGVVAALQDVTELRKLERVRQEFVANASHELKTPLTAIKGFVETLLDGALEDPQNNRPFLETIQEHTNHLMRLIEDLLDLSAIEAKRVAYRFEPLILREVIERIMQALAPMAKAKDVHIELNMPAALPKVRADREKVAQIFMNLIDNAIKFNRDRGSVQVSAEVSGTYLKIRVKDTGFGISGIDLPRVFERFYRADKSHSHDIAGTGLGLAIVKHLTEAHGGTVTAESAMGEGASFTITLPLN